MSHLMQALRHPRLAIRLQLIAVAALLCLFGLGAFAVFDSYSAGWNDRVDKLRSITDEAVSIANGLDRQVQAGALTADQALQKFRDTIRPIRYDGGAGYYFAYAMDGTTLVLGPTPEVEGTSRINIKDADGNFFVQAMIQVARNGGGTAVYRYPKPGSSVAEPKLAYVEPIPRWNMFVATGLYVDDLRAAMAVGAMKFAAMAGVLVLVCAVIAWATSRGITRPLSRLRRSMASLASGDTSGDVPGMSRQDEIGEMAAAVQVFKDNAVAMERLKTEQKEAEKRATEEKRTAMRQLASDFEASVGEVVRIVASATAEMESTAASITATAEETSRQMTAVAAASEHASANVQSVASATEQLSSSVGEISRQVTTSASVASKAVSDAEHTNELVTALADAAKQIGAVTEMISEIASKTNLLALNATIEAARAGDAGKGFAVVASEVKSLANQTAKATQEISNQIAAMQGATSETVAAIQAIGATIGQLNQIATTIASAVEEQSAATQEIARNIDQAAAGTAEVSRNVTGATQTASAAGAAAQQMLGSAGELSRQGEALRGEVDRFLHAVRAA